GARFLLDPRRKHEPTLLSDEVEGRARRREFLERALAIARDLGAGVVSLWSGVRPPGIPPDVCWERLVNELEAGGLRAEAMGILRSEWGRCATARSSSRFGRSTMPASSASS